MPEAPYLFTARSSDGVEERHFVIDERDTMTVRVSRPPSPHAA